MLLQIGFLLLLNDYDKITKWLLKIILDTHLPLPAAVNGVKRVIMIVDAGWFYIVKGWGITGRRRTR